jgi:hypothetical protein
MLVDRVDNQRLSLYSLLALPDPLSSVLNMVKLLPAFVAILGALLPLSKAGDVDTDARHNDECPHPAVRKEWRTLSADEQSAYISAVKVCTFNSNSRLSLWIY